MKFTIETVSEMTGVTQASLRNWEKRYGFPCPERSGGGHRYYSETDVRFIRQALTWISEGVPLSRISQRYSGFCPEKAAEDELKQSGIFKCGTEDDVTYRVGLLYSALCEFNLVSIQQHYSILNTKLSPCQLFDRVFEVILRRVGEDWRASRINVAQEHFISAFIRLRLSVFLVLDFPSQRTERILFGTLGDECHEGGLMLVAAHLRFRGYNIIYVGTGIPVNEFRSLVETAKPSLVCLSYSCKDRFEGDLSHLLCAPEMGIPVAVGGCALSDEKIWQMSDNLQAKHIFFTRVENGISAADRIEMIIKQI